MSISTILAKIANITDNGNNSASEVRSVLTDITTTFSGGTTAATISNTSDLINDGQGGTFPFVDTSQLSSAIGAINFPTSTLQEVTNSGSTTTNNITAQSFIKSGASSDDILLGDGSTTSFSGSPTIYTADGSISGLRTLTFDTNLLFQGDSFTTSFSLIDNIQIRLDAPSVRLASGAESIDVSTLNGISLVSSNGQPITFTSPLAGIKLELPIAPTVGQVLTATNVDGSAAWANTSITIPTLQEVTNSGNTTTNNIIAQSFIKSGATSDDILLGDGSTTSFSGSTSTIDEVLGVGDTATNKILQFIDSGSTKSGSIDLEGVYFDDSFGTGSSAAYRFFEMYLTTPELRFELNGNSGTSYMQFDGGLRLLVNGDTPTVGQVLRVSNVDGSVEWADVSGTTNTLSAKTTADIGSVIPLDTPIGHQCNMDLANSATTYTLGASPVTGAFTRVLINATSEPSIFGATQEGGLLFNANIDMYMVVSNKGTDIAPNIVYWFYKTTIISGSTVTKFSQTFGDNSATGFTINHGLGTEDVSITIKNVSTGVIEYTDMVVVDNNNIQLNFSVAPTTNEYRVTIIG